jgi:hypothetical protein
MDPGEETTMTIRTGRALAAGLLLAGAAVAAAGNFGDRLARTAR